MIAFQCPSCNAAHEVPDAHAGKFARCGCGARVQVPAGAISGAPQASLTIEAAAFAAKCPSCGVDLAEGVVVCLKCGFNRVTGVKIQTALGGKEGKSAAECEVLSSARPRPFPIARVSILGGLVVVVAVGAWFLYEKLVRSPSGIDEERPLGTIERLQERFLGTMRMRKDGPRKIPKGGDLYLFEDPETPEGMKNFHERIRVATDAEGGVRGIVATLAPSGGAAMSPMAKSGGQFFFRDYWKELTGEFPKFRIKSEGQGPFSITTETASFTKDTIEGKWRRGERDPHDEVGIGYPEELAYLKTLP